MNTMTLAESLIVTNEDLGSPRPDATVEEVRRFRARKAIHIAQNALNAALEQARYCGLDVTANVKVWGDRKKVVCNLVDREYP